MANHFGSESNDFYIKDFRFLPSIDMTLLDGGVTDRNEISTDPLFANVDIWDGTRDVNKKPYPKINLEKF